MKTGTSLNLYYIQGKYTAVDAVNKIAEAGIKTYDFNIIDWCHGDSPFLGGNWEDWAKDIDRAASDVGAVFSQAHSPLMNFFLDEVDDIMTRLSKRALEAAAIVKVPWMVFHAGYPNGWDMNWDDVYNKNLDWLGEMLEYARSVGVGIVIENTFDGIGIKRYGSRIDEVKRLTKALGSDVGICLDTGHANIMGDDPGDMAVSFGDRLKVLHVQDNYGKKDDHTVPYYGNIDWDRFIKGLVTAGYTGNFSFEAHNYINVLPEALKHEGVRMMKQIGDYLCSRFEDAINCSYGI